MSRPLWTPEELSQTLRGAERSPFGTRDRASRSTRARCNPATCSSPSRAMRTTATIMSRAPSRPARPPRSSRARPPSVGRSSSSTTRCAGWSGWVRRRGGAETRASSPSPARSARPAPRRCCAHGAWRPIGPTHASAASFNNHWGVPLTLARLPADAAYGVFEIGMNHAGEITPLVGLVRPHVALITTIAPVHIEYLGSIEAIADAKAEIFPGVEPGGVAVLNRDAPQFERLAAAARARGREVRSFGVEPRRRRAAARLRAARRGIAHRRAMSPASDSTFDARRARRAHGGKRGRRAAGRRGARRAVEDAAPRRSPASRRPKGRGERFALAAAERRRSR